MKLRAWLPWLVMATVVIGSLAVAIADDGGPRTPEERAHHLAASVRCPTCRGQSVLESQASVARAIRVDIARRIAEGQTDDEIRASLVAVHGRSILLTPESAGIVGLVWVLPVVALAGALAGLVVAFRRWRVDPAVTATDEDRALVAAQTRPPER